MTLSKLTDTNLPIKYGSIQFNANLIKKQYGKNINFIKHLYNNTKLYIKLNNKHCTIIYNKNEYKFRRFSEPKAPTKYLFQNKYGYNNFQEHFDKAYNNYKKQISQYIIKKDKQKKLTHYETWECTVKGCSTFIILDGLKKLILSHPIHYQHNHNDKIDDKIIRCYIRDSILETHMIAQGNKTLKHTYEEFNNTLYNIIDKDLLATHYNPAFKKKMYRMKMHHNNKNPENLRNKIKYNQLNSNNQLNNSIHNIIYNPDRFNLNKYAIPIKEKTELINFMNLNKDNQDILLNKMNDLSKQKLNINQQCNLAKDFFNSLDNNIEDKSILTQDFTNLGYEIFIIYSIGGLKMLDISHCKIIGCDATFSLSPQLELWKGINKSYQQVK